MWNGISPQSSNSEVKNYSVHVLTVVVVFNVSVKCVTVNTTSNDKKLQAIRDDRDTSEEDSWDEFPIVHDYFYESEEVYFNREGRRREYSNDFQPLCHNVRRRIELKSDVYEYHPSHYMETVCRKFQSYGTEELSRNSYKQMCSEPGFRCVQRTQTLYLTRKRYDSDCWENSKKVIASGCDCMWPSAYKDL